MLCTQCDISQGKRKEDMIPRLLGFRMQESGESKAAQEWSGFKLDRSCPNIGNEYKTILRLFFDQCVQRRSFWTIFQIFIGMSNCRDTHAVKCNEIDLKRIFSF